MALATNGGHVKRAIDFYNSKDSMYFIIGGTEEWSNEPTFDPPSEDDYKLRGIIGLKKIDDISLVVKTTEKSEGVISYRNQNWKRVTPSIETSVGDNSVPKDSYEVTVRALKGLTEGSKIRVNNIYEGTIVSISELTLTLDTPAPENIPADSPIIAGAIVERAKHVYASCYLNYDAFPTEERYRQIGLCTGVIPNPDISDPERLQILLPGYYRSFGTLELLDNRVPTPRDASQRELISVIIEF